MSDAREQIFLVNQREEEKSFKLENLECCREFGSESVRGNKKEILPRVTDHCEEKGEVNSAENSAPGDDDDGFKTPTSSDHKIPSIMQCPPPPRKSRTQSSKLKRKASMVGARGSLLFHELAEVQSTFRPATDEDYVNGSKRSRKVSESD